MKVTQEIKRKEYSLPEGGIIHEINVNTSKTYWNSERKTAKYLWIRSVLNKLTYSAFFIAWRGGGT